VNGLIEGMQPQNSAKVKSWKFDSTWVVINRSCPQTHKVRPARDINHVPPKVLVLFLLHPPGEKN
jgi:hypothetical protein